MGKNSGSPSAPGGLDRDDDDLERAILLQDDYALTRAERRDLDDAGRGHAAGQFLRGAAPLPRVSHPDRHSQAQMALFSVRQSPEEAGDTVRLSWIAWLGGRWSAVCAWIKRTGGLCG